MGGDEEEQLGRQVFQGVHVESIHGSFYVFDHLKLLLRGIIESSRDTIVLSDVVPKLFVLRHG